MKSTVPAAEWSWVPSPGAWSASSVTAPAATAAVITGAALTLSSAPVMVMRTVAESLLEDVFSSLLFAV